MKRTRRARSTTNTAAVTRWTPCCRRSITTPLSSRQAPPFPPSTKALAHLAQRAPPSHHSITYSARRAQPSPPSAATFSYPARQTPPSPRPAATSIITVRRAPPSRLSPITLFHLHLATTHSTRRAPPSMQPIAGRRRPAVLRGTTDSTPPPRTPATAGFRIAAPNRQWTRLPSTRPLHTSEGIKMDTSSAAWRQASAAWGGAYQSA